MKIFSLIILMITCLSCNGNSEQKNKSVTKEEMTSLDDKEALISVGANQTDVYLPLLKGKKVGVTANQTSVIFKGDNQSQYIHLVDSLMLLNIDVKKVFAPEHGFRGNADAGEHIVDGVDAATGLPIVSLYGTNSKPSKENLKDIDIMIFDIQDVGVRFYTYISTLHYIMEACAELNIPVVVLDRPNPNGHYVDGPILEAELKSFVGMHPVPIVYGMTIGEYAKMINGEKWLNNEVQCNLTVVSLNGYTHDSEYALPIKPSPNLPNAVSVNLYPSLCFFEGTIVSCGRGTEMQFQVFGAPTLPNSSFDFSFTPRPNLGSKTPKYNGELCYGMDLRNEEKYNVINLDWLIAAYNSSLDKASFFNPFFSKLAGTKRLQKQIENGLSASTIKETWQLGLDKFKERRVKYLLYK